MWFRTIFRRRPDPDPAAADLPALEPVSLPQGLFPQLKRLRLRTGRRLISSGAGQRPGARRRPDFDFREHRKYVAGDDIRFVDWKASARSEQVFLKQGEHPQETTVHLVLDCSASMRWGIPPKRTAALQLAAALGYLTLHGEDRLQLIPMPGEAADSAAFKGKGQFPAFWRTLRELPFQGSADLGAGLKALANSSRGGIVLVLSDLLDAGEIAEGLAALPRPAWEVSILQLLHPGELNPGLLGEVVLVDAESRRDASYDVDASALERYEAHLTEWRRGIEMACVQHNAFYTLISTSWPLKGEAIPHLMRVDVLEAA